MQVARFIMAVILQLALLMAGSACAAPQVATPPVTAYVKGEETAVIAFLPSSLQQGALPDLAHGMVESALQDTKLCLGQSNVSYKIVFADRVVVRWPGGNETFELGTPSDLVGALLLRPGANARILFAGGGPEALSRLMVPAAAEYFGKECPGS